MPKMKEATLISKINTAFPGARATPIAEWDERSSPGIWFRGSDQCEIDGEPLFDGYETHPKLNALLDKAGWFSEPYDSGTLMAFPQ